MEGNDWNQWTRRSYERSGPKVKKSCNLCHHPQWHRVKISKKTRGQLRKVSSQSFMEVRRLSWKAYDGEKLVNKRHLQGKVVCDCGQYKTRTEDYGLRTGYKIRTRYKTRTWKYGLCIKHELGIKRGLRTADCGLRTRYNIRTTDYVTKNVAN